MRIELRRIDFDAMVAYAQAQLPNEACGLIGGIICGKTKYVKKIYQLTNLDHSPEHFSLDPKEQLIALKDARSGGLQLIGNWHSHPSTPARPSEEDIRLAFDPTASYLILSLAAEKPTLKSFCITGGIAAAEDLVIDNEYRTLG